MIPRNSSPKPVVQSRRNSPAPAGPATSTRSTLEAVLQRLAGVVETLPATNITPLLIDEREAARLLSLSSRKVAYLAGQGRLRSVRVDGSRRYRVSDIEKFVQTLE
ncbi:helix-turn-helix domain-containing protein [Pirellulales bacterium]|nr:helix-turn-helix domain-containing protein [Pirellulales bacterium]